MDVDVVVPFGEREVAALIAAGGTGLQNMEDRIGAAGGTLTIDSRPGAGTWVRAELPLEAAVIPLQRSGDDSRR